MVRETSLYHPVRKCDSSPKGTRGPKFTREGEVRLLSSRGWVRGGWDPQSRLILQSPGQGEAGGEDRGPAPTFTRTMNSTSSVRCSRKPWLKWGGGGPGESRSGELTVLFPHPSTLTGLRARAELGSPSGTVRKEASSQTLPSPQWRSGLARLCPFLSLPISWMYN